MKKILTLQNVDTIKSAFKLLKGQFGMIVCVLSKDRKLTGVVSEGALRRAILKGFPLNTKLKKVQNTDPTYVYESDKSRERTAGAGLTDND